MNKTLTIRAEATYEGYPNVSHFIMGIQSVKPLAEDALAESLSKQRNIVEELKKHGYKEEDIAVLEQHITGGGEALGAFGPRAGFTVTIRLSAQTKDFPHESPEAVMKHFASLSDAVARCGVDMWGKPEPVTLMGGGACVRFSFEDFDGIEATLLERAIAAARTKADQVARSVGKQVNELIAIDGIYSDFEVKGELRGLALDRHEKLTAGGKFEAIKGPMMAGYWLTVCRLNIAAAFGWT